MSKFLALFFLLVAVTTASHAESFTASTETANQQTGATSVNLTHNVNNGILGNSYQSSDSEVAPYYLNTGYNSLIDPDKDSFFSDSSDFAEENLTSGYNEIATAQPGGGWNPGNGGSHGGGSHGGSSGAVPEPAEWALIILAALGIASVKLYQKYRLTN